MIACASTLAEGGLAIAIDGLRLGRGENNREHWRAAAERVKRERGRVIMAIDHLRFRRELRLPPAPWAIHLVRIAPSDGLDDDNLVSSLKAIRDQVAICLGLVKTDKRGRERAADGPQDPTRFSCSQETGPWGVRVEIRSREAVPLAVAEGQR